MNCTSFALFDDVFALALAARRRLRGPDLGAERAPARGGQGRGHHRDLGTGSDPGPVQRTRRACRRRARRGTRRRDLVAQLANGRADPRSARHDPVGELRRLPDAGLLPRWSPAPRGVHGGFADGGVRSAARASVRLLRAAPRGHQPPAPPTKPALVRRAGKLAARTNAGHACARALWTSRRRCPGCDEAGDLGAVRRRARRKGVDAVRQRRDQRDPRRRRASNERTR